MKNTVVLGVTGSIAAYKAADLTSQLVKKGMDVVVIMTASAQKLVCPQTFLTLSRNAVITDLWTMPDWQPGHIELSDRAKLLVIAPCTANVIAKLANGIADDALSTYSLSHTGKIFIVPAMNPKMWKHPTVQQNVKTLKERGVVFIGPASGRVACGDDGVGRMENVSVLLTKIMNEL